RAVPRHDGRRLRPRGRAPAEDRAALLRVRHAGALGGGAARGRAGAVASVRGRARAAVPDRRRHPRRGRLRARAPRRRRPALRGRGGGAGSRPARRGRLRHVRPARHRRRPGGADGMSATAAAAESTQEKRSWLPLGILGAAQFVMVLDSSVMNVSISQIVHDLNTSIQGVQTAITMYTLVMAAFMLVGAKLGDMFGRDRIFAIGLAVYACGSLITALSPNLGVLLFGWSLVEGIGAVMVIPAIAALIASNYEGKQRALAYGVIGGVAGAAIAAGPLIGGWVTTELSWRYVFAGEVVIVIAV